MLALAAAAAQLAERLQDLEPPPKNELVKGMTALGLAAAVVAAASASGGEPAPYPAAYPAREPTVRPPRLPLPRERHATNSVPGFLEARRAAKKASEAEQTATPHPLDSGCGPPPRRQSAPLASADAGGERQRAEITTAVEAMLAEAVIDKAGLAGAVLAAVEADRGGDRTQALLELEKVLDTTLSSLAEAALD